MHSRHPSRTLCLLLASMLALGAGCATLRAHAEPQPTLTAGPMQCVGAGAAATAWPLVEAYVRRVLEEQRAAACAPVPPVQPPPAPPGAPATTPTPTPEEPAASNG